MGIRSLLPVGLMCWPIIALAQVSGQFYMEKSSFSQGEPIFLYFEVVNNGSKVENIVSADPYSFCSGFQIAVSSNAGAKSSCEPMAVGGSCLSSSTPLLPGKSKIDRLLLNFDHKVDTPGEYSVDAVRHLAHADSDRDFFSPDTSKEALEVGSTFYFRVDKDAPQDAKALQPWVDQLRSSDMMKRLEAARTVASLAPREFEDTLLRWSTTPSSGRMHLSHCTG